MCSAVFIQNVFGDTNITVTIQREFIKEESEMEGTENFLQQRIYDVHRTNVLILCDGNNYPWIKQLLHQASSK